MKKTFSLGVAAILAIASAAPTSAQDCLYLIGNMGGWICPSEQNAEALEKFKLLPAGDDDGNTIFQGTFDVSSLNGESPVFRFYSALNGWEQDSLGSQYYDEPASYTMESAENGLYVVEGKGSFKIDDWEGDTMYITFCYPRVYVSNTEFVDLIHPKVPVVEYYGKMYECDGNPGIFTTNVRINNVSYIRIAGKYAGFPEHEWVYIDPANDLTVDDYGIAKSTYSYTTEETWFQLGKIDWNDENEDYRCTGYLYVDTNTRTIYYNAGFSVWVSAAGDNCPEITFENYKEYDNFLIHNTNNSDYPCKILDLPLGQSRYAFSTPKFGSVSSNYYNFATDKAILGFWDANRTILTIDNDKEGAIFIVQNDHYGIIPSLEEIYITSSMDDFESVRMKKVGDNILEADVNFKADGSVPYFYINFSEDSFAPAIRIPYTIILFVLNNKSYTCGWNYSLYPATTSFDQLVHGGKIRISINLKDKTVTYTVLDAEIDTLPLGFYSSDEGEYDFLMARVKDNTFFGYFWVSAEIYNDKYKDVWVRMTDGKYLVPDMKSAKTDDSGVTTYSYSLSDSKDDAIMDFPKAKGNNVAQLFMEIDTSNNKILTYNTNENLTEYQLGNGIAAPKKIFISTFQYNAYPFEGHDFAVSLSELSNLTSLKLSESDPEKRRFVYEERVTIKDGWYQDYYLPLLFGSTPVVNKSGMLFGLEPDKREFFCSEDTDVYETDASWETWPAYMYLDYFQDLPSREFTLRVILDNGKNTIWIGNGEAEVVEIPFESLAMSVAGERGAIRIDAAEQTVVSVYTLAGSLIRKTTVPVGSTLLPDFAPGLYIVNGCKVVVR